jgi:hypothetical protein
VYVRAGVCVYVCVGSMRVGEGRCYDMEAVMVFVSGTIDGQIDR